MGAVQSMDEHDLLDVDLGLFHSNCSTGDVVKWSSAVPDAIQRTDELCHVDFGIAGSVFDFVCSTEGVEKSPSTVPHQYGTRGDDVDYLIQGLHKEVQDAQHCETCQPRTQGTQILPDQNEAFVDDIVDYTGNDADFFIQNLEKEVPEENDNANLQRDDSPHTSGRTSQHCPGSVLHQCFSLPTARSSDEFQLDIIDVYIPQTPSSSSKCVQLLPSGLTQQTRADEGTRKRRREGYDAMSRRDNVDREQLNEHICPAAPYDYEAEAARLANEFTRDLDYLNRDQLEVKARQVKLYNPTGDKESKKQKIRSKALQYFEEKLKA